MPNIYEQLISAAHEAEVSLSPPGLTDMATRVCRAAEASELKVAQLTRELDEARAANKSAAGAS